VKGNGGGVEDAAEAAAFSIRLAKAWVKGNFASLVFLPANCFFFAIFPETRDRAANSPLIPNYGIRNQKSLFELSALDLGLHSS
jgi:hypothetical protein